MKHMPLIAAVGLCALLVSASCARRAQPVAAVAPPPPVVEETPPPPPPPPPDPEPAPAPVAALTEEEIFARKTLDELNAERPLGDVFFDFDKSVVREDARPILQTNAEWLRRWTSTRITIEGHGDSRGTSEYNLALGDRRANAVKQYLLSLGVADDRVLAVTKGEEQPFCREETAGEDLEACWQENRRGHFLITAK
jgi:peptidoglycan-associated lipoprotein